MKQKQRELARLDPFTLRHRETLKRSKAASPAARGEQRRQRRTAGPMTGSEQGCRTGTYLADREDIFARMKFVHPHSFKSCPDILPDYNGAEVHRTSSARGIQVRHSVPRERAETGSEARGGGTATPVKSSLSL